MQNFFEEAPNELVIEIFKHFTFLERIKLQKVCKNWETLSTDKALALTKEQRQDTRTF